MKLFKLVKDQYVNKNDIKLVKVYESENYSLRILIHESGYTSVDLDFPRKRYVPALYLNKDLDTFKVIDIKIETTSYGSLEVNEIKDVVNGYNMAIEEVAELKEILKENNLL